MMVTYQVGAGLADITPADWQSRTYWLAGFDPNRPVKAVHDPLFARAIALESDSTALAIVTLDLLGVVYDDMQIIQAAIAARVPELSGHILIHTTHNHSAPDTIGLWGGVGDIPFENRRPRDYIDEIARQAATAIEEAWNKRRPVKLTVASFDESLVRDLANDSRPPQVRDPHVRLLIFSAGDRIQDEVVATVVNWASHPAVLDRQNQEITADFVKWTVDEIEAQLGGIALYLNGAIGGSLTSSSNTVLPEIPDGSYEKAETVGRTLAQRLLSRLQNLEPSDRLEIYDSLPPLTHKKRGFYLPLNNPILLGARSADRIPAKIFIQLRVPRKERWRPFWYFFSPYLFSEANFARLGPVSILTMGGELYPELLVGGIDASVGISPYNSAPLEVPIIKNPELVNEPFLFFVGLANDFHGYVIPQVEWDGWFEGEYGEQFATSPDNGSIISYNLHLLILGYETGQYPPSHPTFLPKTNRRFQNFG